jgi:choline kinase
VLTYLTHRPTAAGGSASPAIHGRHAAAITPLSLDESPDGPSWQQAQSFEEELEVRVRDLMRQTRLWRVMNSAQWVAWGIVQAKAPGMEEGIAEMNAASNSEYPKNGHDENGNGKTKTPPVDSDVDEEDGFDYLAYAQDRALFFWSDLLALNLVNPEELPAPMVEHIRARAVDY